MKAIQRKPQGPKTIQKMLDLRGDHGPALKTQLDTISHASD